MKDEIFFRALSTPDHFRHYNAGLRNSYHESLPGHWFDLWYKHGEHGEQNYILESPGWGRYTKKALKMFLELAKTKYTKENDPWSESDRKFCSELEGWCSFTKPQDALEYGCNSILAKTGEEKYIVFTGKYIGTIPESDGGSGALASVNHIEGVYSRKEFISKYNLDASSCAGV